MSDATSALSSLAQPDGAPASAFGKPLQMLAKRALDVVGSAVLIVLLLPVLLAIALAVEITSPGPILFRQVRLGLRGKPFEILKFRTLYAHLCDASGAQQAGADDARVTPLGRFLRRTNLDELPQLFNVLAGQMSLVGPRPHVPGMRAGAGRRYEDLVPYYHLRLTVKPGITGWAQCNGLRGQTTDEQLARRRIDYDLHYIERYSLAYDMRILLLTLLRELRGGTGA